MIHLGAPTPVTMETGPGAPGGAVRREGRDSRGSCLIYIIITPTVPSRQAGRHLGLPMDALLQAGWARPEEGG